jgi:hypothetical protein
MPAASFRQMTLCHRYLGTEMDISIRYNVPATSDAVEIMHHIRHINNTLSVPGDATEVGKEVISRIITDLDTQGVMFTDTNGVHTLKRIRNYRETWTLNSSEPISDNYYPVNARAYTPPPHTSLQKRNEKWPHIAFAVTSTDPPALLSASPPTAPT